MLEDIMPIRLLLRQRDNRNVTRRDRIHVLTRDKAICRYCGRAGDEIDHVIPFSWGGPCHRWNLVVACRDCNRRKGARVWLPLPRWVAWKWYLWRRWWWLVVAAATIYLMIRL